MTSSTDLSRNDPRIGKATELAEYLHRNPKAAKQDPEELAERFGVSVSLVAQLTSKRFITRDFEPQLSNAEKTRRRMKRFGVGAVAAIDLLTRNPYLFLPAVALVLIASALPPHQYRLAPLYGIFLWLGCQAFCLFTRPKFRYLCFCSGLNALALARFFAVNLPHYKPFDNLAARYSFAGFCGIVVALLGMAVMSVFIFAGGARAMRAARQREAARSRHDLLSRMFQIQEQLQNLPNVSVKPPHPILAIARKAPFRTAFFISLILGLIWAAQTGLFPQEAIDQMTSRTVTKTKNVTVSIGGVAPLFLALSILTSVLSLCSVLLLGLVATTRRRFAVIAGGLAAGELLATLIPWPLRAFSALPLYFLFGQQVWVYAVRIGIILITRFGLYFNQSLSSLSKNSVEDEATIVSELLEIRHRLSANPALVYVLVVDAAGSTKMKDGEDPLLVEYSFRSYQAWLAKLVGLQEGRVDAMTGDGAICAFGSAKNAFEAATLIQESVDAFNRDQNRLSLPFQLRIALHAGSVVADLDKVQFTNVIDVAAHVEKYSPIGGIAITDPFILAFADLPPLEKAATVDGFGVYSMASKREACSEQDGGK